MSSRQSASVILLVALTPLSAGAQDLQEIEVVGRNVNLLGSASTASEGRVSQDELALRPLLRSGEILETVPGMVATQHSGSGKANQYFLRGFNLDHGTDFATLVDGMPVNMRTHGHGQGYTDLNFIIPELVGEIAYRKGSYYADVGDFSGAGSARIATRDNGNGQSLSLAVGEFGFGRLLLTGAVDNGAGNFLYGLEHQVYDGPWEGIEEDVGKTNLWIKQRWQRGTDEFEVAFMGYDNAWNGADQIPARAVSQGMISELGFIDPSVGGDSSRYSLSGNWQRSTGATRWRGAAYVIDYSMELFSNFTYFTQPGGDQFQQIDDRHIYGGELVLEQDGELAGMAMTNTLGADLRTDDIDRVGLRRTNARQFLDAIRLDAVHEWSTGLHGRNELNWTSSLRSVVALRYDYFDFDVDTLEAGNPATLAANAGSADADLVTANASLIYTFSNNSEIYASIGEGFHSNDARGTTIRLDPVSGEPVATVDPLVTTLGSEIGLRLFFSDRLNASVALWQLDIDSELLFVGDAGNTEDTGVGSERQGIELTSYYQIDQRWSVDLEYSWTDAAFAVPQDGSDDIPGALRHVFSGGINLALAERLNAHLRVRHFGDFPLDGGMRADASTLVNFRLGWQINERVDLALDLLNLFDSNDHDIEYFYESQLAGEAGPVADRHYHVFEPRAARLYLAYRF